MPSPSSNRFASLLLATSAVLTLAGLLLLVLTIGDPPGGGWGFRGFPVIFVAGSATVGWLIMVRRPENRIGLVLAASGVLNAAQLFLTEYAALATRTGLPAANLAAWVNAFIWVPTMALMAGAIPLLFPDGRLLSRRWRPVAWLTIGGVAGLIAIIAAYPDAVDTPRFVDPPIRLPVSDSTLNSLSYVALLAVAAGIVGSGASTYLRWHRSTGVVREQLKWLALSVGLVVLTMSLAIVPNPLAVAVFILAIGTVPLAVGVAVLRYRLYEIDTVISRTLVFGVLTALLTGLFAALQRLLQAIFVGVTGNESDAAIVITTLVLAAGFAPMKSAVERLVNRRFAVKQAQLSSAVDSRAPGESFAGPDLEAVLRRVVREELETALAEIRPVTKTSGASRPTARDAGPNGLGPAPE